MTLPALLLVYVCCMLCCTATFGLVYISTSKTLIEEGDAFEINCTVKPLTGIVGFLLNGNPQGDCTAPVPPILAGTCSTGINQNITTEETILSIASASVSTNIGTWKCTHNTESAEMPVEVFSFVTVLTNNQYELPATIETSSSPNSEFKVFVACGYPQPTISWTLDTCDGSQTGIAVNSPTLTTNTSAGCTSPLVAYTSAIKASALASPTVETCYIPKATMTYSEKPSVMPSSQFTSQVQFPGRSPDSPKSNMAVIIGVVVSSIIFALILIALVILKVCKHKGHQSKSKDKDDMLVPSAQKFPEGTGTKLVPSAQKTTGGTGTPLVPSAQKTPVVPGTQIGPLGTEGKPHIDYHKGMPLEPEGPLKIKTRQDHVEFQWKPPKSDGGSQITEYIVEVHGTKFDTWEPFASSPKIKLQVPMDKFKNGEVMSFRVRAENENGSSKPLLAQEPFKLQNSHDILSDRPVVTNQGRGPAGQGSLLDEVPSGRKLPEPV